MHDSYEATERITLRAMLDQDARKHLTPDIINCTQPIRDAMVELMLAKNRLLRSMNLPPHARLHANRRTVGCAVTVSLQPA